MTVNSTPPPIRMLGSGHVSIKLPFMGGVPCHGVHEHGLLGDLARDLIGTHGVLNGLGNILEQEQIIANCKTGTGTAPNINMQTTHQIASYVQTIVTMAQCLTIDIPTNPCKLPSDCIVTHTNIRIHHCANYHQFASIYKLPT